MTNLCNNYWWGWPYKHKLWEPKICLLLKYNFLHLLQMSYSDSITINNWKQYHNLLKRQYFPPDLKHIFSKSISFPHLDSYLISLGAVVVVIVCELDLQQPIQSVPITTKVVSWNPAHSEVYLIQHVIAFVSDLRQAGGFLQALRFPPPIKLTATI
jgi:hypothetical protein